MVNKFLQRCLTHSIGKVRGVLYVGSHEMQEREQFLNNQITNIIWIDAIEEIVNINKSKISKDELALCCVISDKDNERTDFHIASNNGASSSLLPFPALMPHNANIFTKEVISVETVTIDTLLKSINREYKDYNFLCMDIHGVEIKALEGAKEYLKTCDYVYTEINFIEAYKDCVLYEEFNDYIQQHGFKQVYYFKGKKEYGYLFYERIK